MKSDLDRLERLHALLEKGALSEEEYRREKSRLLDTSHSRKSSTPPVPVAAEVENAAENYDGERSSDVVELTGRKLSLNLFALALIASLGAAYWLFGSPDGEASDSPPIQTAMSEPTRSAVAATESGLAPSIPSTAALLGKAYGEVLYGRPFDPAAGIKAEGEFDKTLSGPQTPGVAFHFDGKEVLIWENCMAHNCPHARSIIGIEVRGPGRFVATIIEGRTEILRKAWFGQELLSHCTGFTCEFEAFERPTGDQSHLSQLTEADLSWSQGGASCRAMNSANQLVFYTEGEAAIRFKGKLRRVAESDGIGVGPWYSDDGFADSLEINVERRSGPTRLMEEGASYAAFLKVFDGSWTSTPVVMTCEA